MEKKFSRYSLQCVYITYNMSRPCFHPNEYKIGENIINNTRSKIHSSRCSCTGGCTVRKFQLS